MPSHPPTPPSRPAPPAGFVLFLAGLLLGLLGAVIGERFTRDPGTALLRRVRDLAADSFVHEVAKEELEENAVRGMLEGLDKYSRFYGPDEIARLDRETTGEFRGIGVVFRRPVAKGQVLFPFPDSPAERAGVRVGDTIRVIDDLVVVDMEPGALQAHIQGAGGRPLHLRVLDRAGEERSVELVPERVEDPTVRHARMLDPEKGVGYLAILSFSHRTPGEVDRAILYLRGEGLQALIIDLRGNPGGILDAAVLVANRFVAEGRIVATRTRHITQETLARPEEATYAGMPLVLLVDEGSASASEVLAGALQDHAAAVLVGEPTYGKGSVQTITPLPEFGARVKITTATYYTPAWRRIERDGKAKGDTGIAPDVHIALDPVLRNELYAHLATYSPPPSSLPAIRAWEEEEGVELVELPPPDPQVQAALDLLAGKLPPRHRAEGDE